MNFRALMILGTGAFLIAQEDPHDETNHNETDSGRRDCDGPERESTADPSTDGTGRLTDEQPVEPDYDDEEIKHNEHENVSTGSCIEPSGHRGDQRDTARKELPARTKQQQLTDDSISLVNVPED